MTVMMLHAPASGWWSQFLAGEAPPQPAAEPVFSAWARAQRSLRPDQPVPAQVPRADVAARLAGAGVSLPLFDALVAGLQPLLGAARSLHFLLTDAEGVVLHAQGSEGSPLSGYTLVGASTAEGDVGTNAIGTCLAVGRGVVVEGAAHFLRAFAEYVCAGMPLRGADGRVLGAVGVVGRLGAGPEPLHAAVNLLRAGLEASLRGAAHQLPSALGGPAHDLVGVVQVRRAPRDPRVDAAYALAAQSAPGLEPLLIVGERGTGRSRLAAFVHGCGPRADQPLTTLQAGTLTLRGLDAALSGGGTVVLCGVEQLSTAAQRRLGAALDAPAPGAARLVGLLQVPAAAAVEAGALLPELSRRLSGRVLRLPPLRERSDLRGLLHAELQRQPLERGEPLPRVTEAFWSAALQRPWLGNLTELRAAISLAIEALRPGAALDARHLPAPWGSSGDALVDLDVQTERALRVALLAHEGNLSAAAASLGVARSTLYRMLERFGLR
jgi:transcriptional regulator of acetoin/glycerol metabolism